MAMQVAKRSTDNHRSYAVMAVPDGTGRKILTYLNHKTQLKLQTERGTLFFFFFLSSRDLGAIKEDFVSSLSFLAPETIVFVFFSSD